MKTRMTALLIAALFVIAALCSCAENKATNELDAEYGPVSGAGEKAAGTSAASGKTDHAEGGDKPSDDAGETPPVVSPEISFEAEGGRIIDGYFDKPSVLCMPGPGGEPSDNIQTAPGTLTAGRWSDNNNFVFWKSVLNRNDWYAIGERWGLFASHRAVFTIKTAEGMLIGGARFTVSDSDGNKLGSAVSDSYGMAFVYYDIGKGTETSVPASYTCVYNIGGGEQTVSGAVAALDNGEIGAELTVEGSLQASAKKLDLMFVIDTTGSMGDELRYIQTELTDVIEKVRQHFEQSVSVRLSVNFYRDHGDIYVVRSNGFTTDIDAAIAELAKQCSDGGGDYPEAVDEALADAVGNHEWDDDAVKLMFFVLDAPPHSDREGTPERIVENALLAAERGIRVIPVASSGVDTETELIMRSLAAVTGGTYVFLTNDSGVGGDHLEPTIGDYTVEMLNELMIDLITRYLSDISVAATDANAD